MIKLKSFKKLESGFITFVKRVTNIPKIITRPLARIILTRNFLSKGPDIIYRTNIIERTKVAKDSFIPSPSSS